MNNVAVFDLDGTLTDTSAVDADCYIRALADTFGIENQSANWSTYQDVTDSGILDDIVQQFRGTAPTRTERQRFIECFVALLDDAYAVNASRFNEIPGAFTFVTNLISDGWTVTIATGGWRTSALKKLTYAGFTNPDWVLASADDARKRTDIVRTSLERAGVNHTNHPTVIFGDAIWDVMAARELRIPLIAVASGDKSHQLREAGAFRVIEDYTDTEHVLALMYEAIGNDKPFVASDHRPAK